MMIMKRAQPLGRKRFPVRSKLVRRLIGYVGLVMLLIGCFSATVVLARANGAPATIILTYLAGVSNYGPETATGVAEVIGAEGEITVGVTGLPRLNGESYEVWLINTRTKEAYNGGRFNTDESQSGIYRQVVQGRIPDVHFNLLVLAVAKDGVEDGGPGERRSIGGYFPVPVADGQQPGELPFTGGEVDDAPQLSLDGLVMLPNSVPKTTQSGSFSVEAGAAPYVLAVGLAILGVVFLVGVQVGRRRVLRRVPQRVRRNR